MYSLFSFTVFLWSLSISLSSSLTERPVIGILAQPNWEKTEYYVAASYVKWLESVGARSLPIPYNADDETVTDIFQQVNGILFPGGAVDSLPPSARKVWALAKEANENGDKFPLWGTCLGFEYFVMLAGSKGENTLQSGFDARNISLLLLYSDSAQDSVMFADDAIRNIAGSHNVTSNFHRMGIEPGHFMGDAGLSSTFKIVSTSLDRKGRPFVSAIEAINTDVYPFYGVQFHPEKNNFEYGTFPGTDIPYEAINHSSDAIEVSTHLARLFVSLARQNMHVYSDVDTYPLIWEYDLKHGSSFEQRLIIPDVTTPNFETTIRHQ
mmetsp:Transcript_40436/g.59416  ORF Transcript_40436/g.59416 Transcript_40436/m.59416 type:complete len:323 (+) Transcript_40436:114-1082(+)